VAEVLPLSESERRLLESLVRHRVNFMVVGLSAAALQGAPVVTEDFDLWFEDLNASNFTRAIREVGAAYVPPFGYNPPMLAGPGSDPFDIVIHMHGLGRFEEEIANAKRIKVGDLQLKVLSLERIIASKTATGRPKDLLVLPALRNALRTSQTRKKANIRRANRRKRPRRKTA
jgi:hypothetical protein